MSKRQPYFTKYVRVLKWKALQVEVHPIAGDCNLPWWFEDEHLQEILQLLRRIIFDRVKLKHRDVEKGMTKSQVLTGSSQRIGYVFRPKPEIQNCLIPSAQPLYTSDSEEESLVSLPRYRNLCLHHEKLVIYSCLLSEKSSSMSKILSSIGENNPTPQKISSISSYFSQVILPGCPSSAGASSSLQLNGSGRKHKPLELSDTKQRKLKHIVKRIGPKLLKKSKKMKIQACSVPDAENIERGTDMDTYDHQFSKCSFYEDSVNLHTERKECLIGRKNVFEERTSETLSLGEVVFLKNKLEKGDLRKSAENGVINISPGSKKGKHCVDQVSQRKFDLDKETCVIVSPDSASGTEVGLTSETADVTCLTDRQEEVDSNVQRMSCGSSEKAILVQSSSLLKYPVERLEIQKSFQNLVEGSLEMNPPREFHQNVLPVCDASINLTVHSKSCDQSKKLIGQSKVYTLSEKTIGRSEALKKQEFVDRLITFQETEADETRSSCFKNIRKESIEASIKNEMQPGDRIDGNVSSGKTVLEEDLEALPEIKLKKRDRSWRKSLLMMMKITPQEEKEEFVDCDEITTELMGELQLLPKQKMNPSKEMQKTLNAIRHEKELTSSDIEMMVLGSETYLKKIFMGKVQCRRHEEYKKGGMARRNLNYQVHLGMFSEMQQDVVMETLMSIFCKRHHKYMDYILKVLLPETLIQILMEIKHTSYEETEAVMSGIIK